MSEPGNFYMDPIQVKKGALYIALISHDQPCYYQIKAKYYNINASIPHELVESGD
jgi:hypothetical protein